MAKLKIETGEKNEVLRERSREVEGLSGGLPASSLKLGDFVKGMKKQLDSEKGLGLAAPQVGENVRVVLCRMNAGTDQEILFVMVNPEILKKSWDGDGTDPSVIADAADGSLPEGAELAEEGCLSLPGYYVKVVRASKVVVRFRDGRGLLKGRVAGQRAEDLGEVALELGGLNARVVQHEVDHLDGVLICDKKVG